MALTGGARPNLIDHFVIVSFVCGVLYLLGAFRILPSGWPLPLFIVAYALFWIALGARSVKGSVYQCAVAHVPEHYTDSGALVHDAPAISRTRRARLDFNRYITERGNRNIFVSGRSGSGKSTMMRWLIGSFPGSEMTIFSFKSGDEYLKLGVPILPIAGCSGSPFLDKEAFVQAFLVTYPRATPLTPWLLPISARRRPCYPEWIYLWPTWMASLPLIRAS